MKFMFCIAAIAIVLFAGNATGREACREDQEWVECANPCPPTCAEPNRQPCPTFACSPGCACKKGLLLDENSGKCTSPQKCSKSQSCSKENEEFTTCGSLCRPTCQSPCREPVFCPALCVEKCDCKPGYTRNELTGKCILTRKCPRCQRLCNKN